MVKRNEWLCLVVAFLLQWSLVVYSESLDKEKLQRGASLYVNYCLGCHSLRYLSYEQMARDMGLVDSNNTIDITLLIPNLILDSRFLNNSILTSMPGDEALRWFGRIPPDLSLIIKTRGDYWLYHYLDSFYPDNDALWGTNNRLIPNTTMPNVLGSIIGFKKNGPFHSMTDPRLNDLVYFLSYVGEPQKTLRFQVGALVIILLFILLLIFYQLKKSYWKDAG